MKRTSRLALSVLTSLAIHNFGFTIPAAAETVTVTRGPNGAAHQVKADRIPQDAQVRVETPATGFPNLVTKGPQGAAHISSTDSDLDTTAQSIDTLEVVTRGPNGAAHIAN
ncbi:hypothetical protein [Acaryochloris sp. IP29b_bin.148]|uniref:hypothetical protein n=1 Tax=Acaryochloris sp. IP29b_bin.148 TaxID=2969218 RepID=UPI00261E6526|nr:hypothetical protein [Acaryochloris sp. IP29b_bin.148]